LELTLNNKSELKRAYKENPPPAGIYRITNAANNKIFLGKGMNVRGILNSQQAQLQFGAHQNRELQQDYNQFGAQSFVFDVVDELALADKTPQEMRADLDALEELWLEKLQPYGARGYNKPSF
jgi:hypothetical protein